MCAERIPESIAHEGHYVTRTFQTVIDSVEYTVHERVPDLTHLLNAIASLEGIVMSGTRFPDPRKFAWLLTGRTYTFTMLHMIWLHTRHILQLSTPSETDAYHLFTRFCPLQNCSFSETLAQEIIRVSLPTLSSTLRHATLPVVRSGLFISDSLSHSASGIPTRHVYLTDAYKSIPSIRISQNMSWLLCNRRSVHRFHDPTPQIVCALLSGTFDECHFIINDGTLSFHQLFNLLCTNPALFVPLTSNATSLAHGSDAINGDVLCVPMTFESNEALVDGSPNPWLEPQLGPSCFELVRTVAGVFSAFDSDMSTFEQLELPDQFIDQDEYNAIISDFNDVPPPQDLRYDPNFWMRAILAGE